MRGNHLQQAKLGCIPEDWRIVNIEDAQIRIIDGDRGKNYPKHDEFTDNGYCLFLNASNVTKSGFNFDSCQFISPEKDKLLRNGRLKRNDLVLTTRGTVGNVAYYDTSILLNVIRINSGMVILRNEDQQLDNKFLYTILGAHLTQNQIKRIAFGSAQPALTVTTIKKLKIPLPPIAEQRRIAEILGTWDEAISLTQRLIEAKQRRKKGLMQRLLTGSVRLPGFAKSNAKQETKYGQTPKDWRLVHISDVASVNAKTLSEKSDPNKEYFYIELSAVDNGKIAFPEESLKFAELPSRARRIVRKRDVIMSTVRPNLQGFAVCDFDPKGFICSTGFALITPKILSDSQFIYQSLYGDIVSRQLHGLVTGSNYPAINSSEVKNLKLAWPLDSDERHAIAAVLQTADEEIGLLERKLAGLRQQKKGLMQRLLTGKVRVSTLP